jgi:hypothetical protein
MIHGQNQLSLNYVSLFERLVSKFGEISEIVRMGSDYVKLFRDMRKPVRVEVVPITQALASIYDVAISFCQKACSIFAAGRKGWLFQIVFYHLILNVTRQVYVGRLNSTSRQPGLRSRHGSLT